MAVKFMSDEYLEAFQQTLNESDVFQNAAKGQSATLQQIVTGTPEGELRYWFKLDGGKVEVGRGDMEGPEATITQDYETAIAMAKGEITGQAAFMQGKLKIGGNLMKMMQLQNVFTAMPQALASLEVEY